jgi:hypothetical protein
VTILATAIGEESFSDTISNGSFDNGEDLADMPERFMDHNENGIRDLFEPYYDFNSNSTYDPADGDFNGVLCLDTSGRCSTNVTTGISASNLIIMSDNTPDGVSPPHLTPIPVAPLAAIPAPGSGTVAITFADLNGNPLPSGTDIVGSVTGTGISIVAADASFEVPCTTEPTTYPFTITKTAGATTGTLTIRVTTPSPGSGQGGVTTVLSYPIR